MPTKQREIAFSYMTPFKFVIMTLSGSHIQSPKQNTYGHALSSKVQYQD